VTAPRPKLRDVSRHDPPTIAGRVPPHDLDAEAAVLSTVLLTGDLDTALAILPTGAEFYSHQNAAIFDAAVDLRRTGAAIDLLTVAAYLRDRGAVGAAAYLAEIADKTPAVANVADHARIVAAKARLRRVIATCQGIAAEGYGDVGPDPDAWCSESLLRLEQAARIAEVRNTVSVGDALATAITQVTTAANEAASGMLGWSTGLRDLDEATAGLYGGDLTLCGGKRGGGKSAFAGNLALTFAMRGDGVLWLSGGEMLQPEIAARMACMNGRVDWFKIRKGTANGSDWSRLILAQQLVANLPVDIHVDPRLTIAKIRAQVRRSAATFAARGIPLRLVVVDYHQLLDGKDLIGPNEKREREVSELGRHLRNLAMEPLTGPGGETILAHVLDLSQTNSDGELRESRALEMHAVNVWNVEADPKPAKFAGPTDGRPARVRITKQRSGPQTATASCYWHPQYTLFHDDERL
jgi:replicative DNA helicase